jgi:hypothetical protein
VADPTEGDRLTASGLYAYALTADPLDAIAKLAEAVAEARSDGFRLGFVEGKKWTRGQAR